MSRSASLLFGQYRWTHGTAFDIAGKNIADATNMKAAMRLAARMAAGKVRRSSACSLPSRRSANAPH